MKEWRDSRGNVVFTEKELACPCCGECNMNERYMRNLVMMREHAGFPFSVNSACRCKKHNKEVGGYPSSRHVDRGDGTEATDIQAYGAKALVILTLAKRYGMLGVGVSAKGDFKDRFIHLDGRTSPALWSY